MINITEKELKELQQILKNYPGILVFGSRVLGTNRKFSDLDICLKRENKIPLLELSELREKLEESNLPFTVDIIDYQRADDKFKEIIDKTAVEFPYNK